MAAVIKDDEIEEVASVRDDIEAAREEINARDKPDAQEMPVREDRDSGGRFKARDSQEPKSEPQTQEAREPQETFSTLLAPQGWAPAEKAIWQTLPENARAAILRREQDMHRTITKQDEERSIARQFNEISQQHKEAIEKTGLPPLRLYQDFLGYVNTLSSGTPQSKAMLLRDVAMRNGIDPRALAGIMPPPNSPQAQAPAAPLQPTPLPPEVAETVKWAKEYQAKQQAEAKAAEESAQQKTLEEIVAFRSKPEARFFDAVKDQMVALLQSGAVGNLEEAYNQAIWTRPDIRTILMKEESEKASAEALKLRKASQARVRGGSVKGGIGSPTDANPGSRSLREELQANFAETRGRI